MVVNHIKIHFLSVFDYEESISEVTFLNLPILEKFKMASIQNTNRVLVESYENTHFVGFWVWRIHVWDYFLDSAILKKFKMVATKFT